MTIAKTVDSMTKSREAVLARLIADADKDQPTVRAVLNGIKVEQTREENIRGICGKKGKAQDLKDTLNYLYCTDIEDNLTIKENLAAEAATLVTRGLAEKIISRVENLLPEDCSTCRKEYCYKPPEAPVLRCFKCSKGACPSCYEDDKDVIKNLKMMQGGLYYLCQTCTLTLKKTDEISMEGRTAQWKKKQAEDKEKEKENSTGVVLDDEEEEEDDLEGQNDSCIFTADAKDDNNKSFEEVGAKKKKKKASQK